MNAEYKQNLKTIKINFCDFWPGFNKQENLIINVLKKYYKTELSDNPDFLFYSCFGNEFRKYSNCVKVFITGENVTPNFNDCDYGIGFDDINFGDRYKRFNIAYSFIRNKRDITEDLTDRRFCNFIYSNATQGEGAILRQEFFKKLSEYKHIDAPGKVCNNMQTDELEPRSGNWYESKSRFLSKYKFTIAFENSKSFGYTTEKLFQPIRVYSVPIYWGNPDIVKDINPKCFINCNDYNDFDSVIRRVIELDNDDKKYLQMLKEKPILKKSFLRKQDEELEKFLINIIKKGNTPYNRDPLCFQTVSCKV